MGGELARDSATEMKDTLKQHRGTLETIVSQPLLKTPIDANLAETSKNHNPQEQLTCQKRFQCHDRPS